MDYIELNPALPLSHGGLEVAVDLLFEGGISFGRTEEIVSKLSSSILVVPDVDTDHAKHIIGCCSTWTKMFQEWVRASTEGRPPKIVISIIGSPKLAESWFLITPRGTVTSIITAIPRMGK